MELLTREQFRKQVFRRDGKKCVVCDKEAVDAHHIIDRKLFPDGGYYLDNGVSLCAHHHLCAEETIIGTDELRLMADIRGLCFPPGFRDQDGYMHYDKWGNIVYNNPDGNGIHSIVQCAMFSMEDLKKILPKHILSKFI